MGKHNARDTVTGRWARVPTENTALSADSRFEVMRELEVKTHPDAYAYGLTGRYENNAAPEYDAPPVADDLGVGGSPLRARNPELVSDRDWDTTEWHARPRRETLRPDKPGEIGRALPAQMRYITGDLGQAQPSPLRARNPELVHPDDADHPVHGQQGAVLRTAARGGGGMDPSAYLVGRSDADD